MSILTPITRIALVASALGVTYAAITQVMPGRNPVQMEPGYVNPANVKFYKPKNDSGKTELYLKYEGGQGNVALPIMTGPSGPTVGSPEYNWNSFTVDKREQFTSEGWVQLKPESKSKLVAGSWGDLLVDTRKIILKGELEAMIEKYGK